MAIPRHAEEARDILGGPETMLKYLRINNIAIINSLEVELADGLTLFTGETGAGKSIVVDSLGLVLGDRASSDLVRTGEEQGVVEAVWHSIEGSRFAVEHGLPCEDDEIVIRREIASSGRGRATVNGALVPVALLRDLGAHLAAVHGQHEPQGLLDPSTHIDLLDEHAGLASARSAVAQAHGPMREAEAALQSLLRDRRELERRREMLEFQWTEIEKADLQPGEDEDLRVEKVRQANAGRLLALSSEAYQLLYEDEDAALARLRGAFKRVEELAALDPAFASYLEAWPALKAQAEDLAFALRDYRDTIQEAPGRLDEIETRLALIDRLKRKYGASVDEILAYGADCRRQLDDLGAPEEREKQLRQALDDAARRYLKAANDLSRRRHEAAPAFERRVQAELTLLAMEKTRFEVQFSPEAPGRADDGIPAAWTERGLEQAELLMSPNPGEELRPLARIASGGELSRILLALKSVASLDTPGKTLVFDEVDAGIGGRVAEVVGRKLRGIAERHQVLCVTHLPQIASLADRHFAVEKRVERGRTLTDVRVLGGSERVEEVARMLGGETVSEAARKHARDLVKQGLRN
jgi:DNA repair protein RecN (Recombination protein N)